MRLNQEIQTIDPYHWVARHADYMYNYAIARIDDEEQAKDLVQETFLAALEKRSAFEGRSSERTWLTAILKHKIIDIYRKRSSQPERQTAPEFFDPADGHWNPAYRPQPMDIPDPLAEKEFARILQQCMKKMPALWSSVFTMRHMEDLTTENICSELKVTPSNFWVIIHRAKLNLRACLQRYWI